MKILMEFGVVIVFDYVILVCDIGEGF